METDHQQKIPIVQMPPKQQNSSLQVALKNLHNLQKYTGHTLLGSSICSLFSSQEIKEANLLAFLKSMLGFPPPIFV